MKNINSIISLRKERMEPIQQTGVRNLAVRLGNMYQNLMNITCIYMMRNKPI